MHFNDGRHEIDESWVNEQNFGVGPTHRTASRPEE
jgi:hypothetical protein